MRGPIICDLCVQLLIVKADGHANEVLGRTRPFDECASSVCNLNTKEHKSKSAAITQTENRVQNLAGVRNETKSSESKFGKAQVSIC